MRWKRRVITTNKSMNAILKDNDLSWKTESHTMTISALHTSFRFATDTGAHCFVSGTPGSGGSHHHILPRRKPSVLTALK